MRLNVKVISKLSGDGMPVDILAMEIISLTPVVSVGQICTDAAADELHCTIILLSQIG